MKLKEFTFIGVGPNPKIESSMEILSRKEISGD
jgi:hypothetical protein